MNIPVSYEQMLLEQKAKQLLKKQKLDELIVSGGLKEWADNLVAQGKELKMTWDGGGDSGWVDFQIDGESVEGDDSTNAEILRELCYEILDYGSWAGEFSASGECIYDPETGAFEGTDYYSEDDDVPCNSPIEVSIPADIWFDTMELTVQDMEMEVEVDFVIKNGFDFPNKELIEKNVAVSLRLAFQNTVDKFVEESGIEFRSMWEEISIPFADFKDMGDGTRKATIESFRVGTFNESEKDIVINLKSEEEDGN